ncbi:MAG: Iron-sulfur cluster assembly protein [Candidatus Gottesmanbacteria bacterium GW2011_GWA2_44_17]|uniref:Iron-sulfur cluster assembly protein n=3 Tax=Candidatus Gottesmaniibacteriota TaxID=1752720 RepID=A0A0G1KXN8_9BACT|nr:MAG: Iron-sulfur cluster assembly protein [Microgenomates group bacterium GW2011_GWC1_43_11]KKT38327.1 MAG: Iron-sulfur cluster assembly protein [Candidatus Gottesmanbacteria bacterium GW2011_GWB1_44_11c]KKT47924.1 MAG: Iron-sulfur cluster assembly protein [Candidatus Gottesmanbacteria bacterium GW2011_GWA2_44_17]KKT61082.1 MAG: Iron-sulfur cluster assembly protein [Candidatus Gottesmanbacteria bacterium GW2011_GWA1_44_24b]HCM82564.1 SUF system NifU family Fe-S cluster assembly protein [Pate
MDLYRQHILDHYKHPHHFGRLPKADISKTLFNSACGDRITMELKLGKDGKTITDIRFSGEGCAISQASASLLTDYVFGMKKTDVMKLQKETVLDMLKTELTPTRIKCALLPLEALQKCILEWEKATVV